MSFIDGLRHRVQVWMHPRAYVQGIDEEMRQHMLLDASHHGRTGVADAARRRFGNPTYLKEERRRVAGLDHLDGVALDARHLLRSLRGSPGFSVVAILTLALGIGVTTAVVSVADHILLRALPFRDAGRLMMLLERDEHGGFRPPSAPTALDWQRDPAAAQAFDGVSFIRGDGVSLQIGDATEVVGDGFVGPEFFPLVGAQPALGRVLTDDDHRPGAPPVAVMAYKLWQRRYGGDTGIVGRTINIDSVPTTVVGVLAPGAVYPPFAELWSPISHYRHQEILQRRSVHADSRTIGRLRAGVDSARAVTMMRSVGARLAAEYPADQAHWAPAMFSVQSEIVGDVRSMLFLLAAASVAVLLLVCANVASLLLARATARAHELALRSALGASRARVLRQLLTESLVLAALGGGVGAVFAAGAVRLARNGLASRLPRVDELGVDARVLLIAAGATIVTAVLCGLWPAIRATQTGRSAHAGLLRASALGSIGAPSAARVRRLLVTVQFALALMLLIGAGLLLQSFRRAAAVDLGFDPRGVVMFRIRPPEAYAAPEAAAALYGRLMDATRSVPGVTDVAFINHAPFGPASIYTTLSIDGRTNLDSSNLLLYRTVSSNYLRTMRMTLAAGRWFDENDMRSPGGSFVINQAMARLFWPGADPVGRAITVTRASQARIDVGQPLHGVVVGVVADIHQTRRDLSPDPEVYVPYTLETWPWGMLVVRSQGGARMAPSLARAVRSVDPRLVAAGAKGEEAFGSMEDAVASTLLPRKTSMTLVGAFAICALFLASIGMYGAMAYNISRRTREIGVRKALGATDRAIAALLFRESVVVIVVGVALGAGGAALGAGLVRAFLFNTRLVDPATYVVTISLLAGAASLATYVPARRATRLDPTIAMRGE